MRARCSFCVTKALNNDCNVQIGLFVSFAACGGSKQQDRDNSVAKHVPYTSRKLAQRLGCCTGNSLRRHGSYRITAASPRDMFGTWSGSVDGLIDLHFCLHADPEPQRATHTALAALHVDGA